MNRSVKLLEKVKSCSSKEESFLMTTGGRVADSTSFALQFDKKEAEDLAKKFKGKVVKGDGGKYLVAIFNR